MKFNLFIAVLLIAPVGSIHAGDTTKVSHKAPWSQRIADSFLLRHPDAVTYDTGFTEQKWNYEQGLMLWSLYQTYLHTGNRKYLGFIIDNLDQYVEPTGAIKTYKRTDYNIDLIAPGRALLVAYEKTGAKRFRFAADTLRQQLREHPRTKEGGFWHKRIYPYQMWLDGLFMAEPFYAMYAKAFNEHDSFDDIAHQFISIAQHTRDSATGLYYHAWDESKEMPWANKRTGCSPSFWGRAVGWYVMALVDVIEYFPSDHPKCPQLIGILKDVAQGLLRWRDTKSSLWYLVLDKGDKKGNYLESSSAGMFTYAFAKGARKGYLDKRYFREAERSFKGMLRQFVTVNPDGAVNLHSTIKGAGLGGNPYRDGTFEYYTGEKQRTNDMKGIGPFLLAAIELEKGLGSKR